MTDIWYLWDRGCYVVIPTNICLDRRGRAVMGAGLARQAADRFPALRCDYGRSISSGKPHYIDHACRLICVPTKTDWRGPATLARVESAVAFLYEAAPDIEAPIAVPRLGCGLGGLNWNDVASILARLPAPQFTIC